MTTRERVERARHMMQAIVSNKGHSPDFDVDRARESVKEMDAILALLTEGAEPEPVAYLIEEKWQDRDQAKRAFRQSVYRTRAGAQRRADETPFYTKGLTREVIPLYAHPPAQSEEIEFDGEEFFFPCGCMYDIPGDGWTPCNEHPDGAPPCPRFVETLRRASMGVPRPSRTRRGSSGRDVAHRDGREDQALAQPLRPSRRSTGDRRDMSDLWFSSGGGLTRWFAGHGDEIDFTSADDVPEFLWDDAPDGWSVWDGTVRKLTAEDMAGERAAEYEGQCCGEGSEWWQGSLRPATAEEVVGFFGLRAATEEEPTDG